MQSLKSQVVRCESLKVPGDAGSDPTLNCRNPLEDFGLSEISNIGCRVERIRPLVNLDQNKPNSRRASSPPKKISSLKAVLAATGLQNTMADDGKENVSPQANKHKRLLPHKGSKAAVVASQWLDINCQDLKGRLAALKRSRKRVRAVIKERFRFPVNQTLSASSEGEAYRNLERDHMEKWRTLFVHMDNCLSSEASQLESKLQRMKDLLTHCHQGLEGFQKITSDALQQPNVMEGDFRSGTTSEQIIEKRFAVEAAAASLYSTANFVSVTERMPSL